MDEGSSRSRFVGVVPVGLVPLTQLLPVGSVLPEELRRMCPFGWVLGVEWSGPPPEPLAERSGEDGNLPGRPSRLRYQ